jgi:tryptophanyl-tRNA synthetase
VVSSSECRASDFDEKGDDETATNDSITAVCGEASFQQTSFKNTIADKTAGTLENIKRRMEVERQNVIDYVDKKKESEILADIALFWKNQ